MDKFELFTGLCNADRYDDAAWVLTELPTSVIVENSHLITSIVDNLVAQGKYENALTLSRVSIAGCQRLVEYLLSIEFTCLFRLDRTEESKAVMNKWLQLGYAIRPEHGLMFGWVLLTEERYQEVIDITTAALRELFSIDETLEVAQDEVTRKRLKDNLISVTKNAMILLEDQMELKRLLEEQAENERILEQMEKERLRLEQAEKERILEDLLETETKEKNRRLEAEKEKVSKLKEKKNKKLEAEKEKTNKLREERNLRLEAKKEKANKLKGRVEEGKRKTRDKDAEKILPDKNVDVKEVDGDSPPKRLKVLIPLEVDIPLEAFNDMSETCFTATLRAESSSFSYGMVKAQAPHTQNIQELIYKCSKHEALLSISGVTKVREIDVLLCEEVQDVLGFFRMKMKELTLSQKDRWNSVANLFWQIFRDVSQGLIHLFKSGEACGDLTFNTFVNRNGRGRILPSMISCKKKTDWVELVKLMKSVINVIIEDDDYSILPGELLSFLNLASVKGLSDSIIPLQFLVDHPYFWPLEEKLRFAYKLRKLIRSHTIFSALDEELKSFNDYDDWSSKLDEKTVYKSVWTFGEALKPYRNKVDIVRYYWSVVTHANEDRYDSVRGKKLSEQDIESGLRGYFPKYYQDMFLCVCKAVINKPEHIGAEELGSLWV